MKFYNIFFENREAMFFMLQMFIFCFVGLYLTIITHELSHYIVAKMAKWEVVAFKPYPHKYKDEWVGGAIYYQHNHENMHYMPIMLCAPLWKAYALFAMWSILGFLYFPLWGFAICELVDYLEWWFGYLFKWEKTDGYIYRCLMALHKK